MNYNPSDMTADNTIIMNADNTIIMNIDHIDTINKNIMIDNPSLGINAFIDSIKSSSKTYVIYPPYLEIRYILKLSSEGFIPINLFCFEPKKGFNNNIPKIYVDSKNIYTKNIGIENKDIENKDIENKDIENKDIEYTFSNMSSYDDLNNYNGLFASSFKTKENSEGILYIDSSKISKEKTFLLAWYDRINKDKVVELRDIYYFFKNYIFNYTPFLIERDRIYYNYSYYKDSYVIDNELSRYLFLGDTNIGYGSSYVDDFRISGKAIYEPLENINSRCHTVSILYMLFSSKYVREYILRTPIQNVPYEVYLLFLKCYNIMIIKNNAFDAEVSRLLKKHYGYEEIEKLMVYNTEEKKKKEGNKKGGNNTKRRQLIKPASRRVLEKNTQKNTQEEISVQIALKRSTQDKSSKRDMGVSEREKDIIEKDNIEKASMESIKDRYKLRSNVYDYIDAFVNKLTTGLGTYRDPVPLLDKLIFLLQPSGISDRFIGINNDNKFFHRYDQFDQSLNISTYPKILIVYYNRLNRVESQLRQNKFICKATVLGNTRHFICEIYDWGILDKDSKLDDKPRKTYIADNMVGKIMDIESYKKIKNDRYYQTFMPYIKIYEHFSSCGKN